MSGVPAISVLMPVHNPEPFLRAAVESVLAQTFTDLELVVVNDGSTDGSRALLSTFSDPRIRIVDNPRNLGLIASLNIGLGHIRGRYMARMDGDDIMHPGRLKHLFELLEADPGLVAAATGVELIDRDGATIGTWDRDLEARTEADIRRLLPRTNCLASIMVRSAVVKDLRYRPAQAGVEDWDLLLRMSARGMRIARIAAPLYGYRIHAASVMGRSKRSSTPEMRSLRMRHRFLLHEWAHLHFSRVHLAVVIAQVRSLARHVKVNLLPPLLRDLYRLFTYSPVALLRERRGLHRALDAWNGEHLFCFPYMCVGGAEQIHADILAAVADRAPLTLICGRSQDRSFEERFRRSSAVAEVGHLLHHPLTRRAALRRIARRLDLAKAPTLFSSLTDAFFDLLPRVGPHVRTFHLQHAFLYQPGANKQARRWMSAFPRVDHFVFYSGQAMADWQRFMRANGISWDAQRTFLVLPNAVHTLRAPEEHERLGVLFVGRRSPVKRVELFLAIADALERARPGHFRFSVAGYEAMGVHPQVTFHGRVGDPAVLSGLYSAHDVVVQTSTLEGFPMVIMEAMAHGMAILSTPVGDVPNRTTPDVAILTSSVDAPVVEGEMVAAIQVLDRDRERLRAMRQEAYAKAGREYGWDAFRARYRSALIRPDAASTSSSR